LILLNINLTVIKRLHIFKHHTLLSTATVKDFLLYVDSCQEWSKVVMLCLHKFCKQAAMFFFTVAGLISFFPAWAADADVGAISSLQDLTTLEISNMVQAQEIAFIDTGFFTTIENLDDLVTETETNLFDWINYGGGTKVIDIRTGTFQPDLEDLLDLPNRWQGNYIAGYHPTRISIDGAGYDPGTPLDFWGTPYLLFSPLGLLKPETMSVTLEYYGDTFDRYAIVSLGMDREMSEDDVIRLFGTAPTRAALSSVSLSSTPTSGTLLLVKGYNFGSEETAAVMINGESKNNLALTWAPNEILLDLSKGGIPQVGVVQVVPETGEPSGELSYSLPPFLRAYDWELYR
jgi:hypothetical protein